MKKKIITICSFIIIFMLACSVIFNEKEKKDLVKVKVAEVAHSIFYAPQYVALHNGYFKDVGLDVELILTPGADKVTAAVLSGDVDIGFSGSEATIYIYNQGEKDYLKTFAGLTQKDGSFIVARNKIDNFTLNDLKGKYIIGGRIGGMPEMTLEYILTKNNINPTKDLTIDTSIAFAAMQGAFQTADVAKQAVGELTTYGVQLTAKIGTNIASMIAAFPSQVTKKATAIAAEQCKEELQQRLKEVMGTPAEDHAQKEAEKEKENKTKKAIDWCKKAVKDANEFKDKTLSSIQKDCEDISALMIQGPGWVNNQMSGAIDSAKTYMSDYADGKMKDIKNHYDEAVNNSAYAAATTMKKKLIDPTLEKAKNQFNDLGTSTNKTKQKAKTAVQKQLFKLAGKLGISPNG